MDNNKNISCAVSVQLDTNTWLVLFKQIFCFVISQFKKNENKKTYTKPLSRMMNPVLFHGPQVPFPSIVVDHSVHEIGYIKQMSILKSIKNFIV